MIYKIRIINLKENIPSFNIEEYYWRCACFERDKPISISQSIKINDGFYGVTGFRFLGPKTVVENFSVFSSEETKLRVSAF